MSTEFPREVAAPGIEFPSLAKVAVFQGIKRRWLRERRRRKVGRAYDMALEIARVIPCGSQVLDIGCGNGFIAHHLSAMLGMSVVGIDVMPGTQASIDYRRYDGARIPLADNSVDAVLLCYVLHHAQNAALLLSEITRVLRPSGLAVIYEDIPDARWDRFVCRTHDLKWRKRAGACTFRDVRGWRTVFDEAGFEIIRERQLSRLRNLTHPVCRRFYVLRATTAINATFKDEVIATDDCNFSFTNLGKVKLLSNGNAPNLILSFDELVRMQDCELTADDHLISSDCRGLGKP